MLDIQFLRKDLDGAARRLADRPFVLDAVRFQVLKNTEFRPQRGHGRLVGLADLAALRANLQDLGQDVRKRNYAAIRMSDGGFGAGWSIRELLHPVKNADGELFFADGAFPVAGHGFPWRKAHPTTAVAVQVVFALLRVKFNGTEEVPRSTAF